MPDSDLLLPQADATQEYFVKSAQWDREKKVRKARGLEWPCASCGLHFPANGFIDDSTRHTSDQLASRDAVQEYCIAPGSLYLVIVVCAHVVIVSCAHCVLYLFFIAARATHIRGHWRYCRACAGLQLDATTASKPDATTRECEKCKQHRPLQYFQESPSMCIACALHADFEHFHVATAKRQCRCNIGAGAWTRTASDYALVVRWMLQALNVISVRE